MLTEKMISGIESMRPVVPAKDFAVSQRFYETLGFQLRSLGPQLTEMSLGRHSVLLQDFYVPDYASNFVIHMLVDDVDKWWDHIASLSLEESFQVQSPRAPKLQPWGLRVLSVFDPSTVLWQIASRPS
jgi:glyoxalase/bleomycin resistance protein/dioxygenase superfamily protein